jgi:DNA-binding transcriptional MerR regulator
MDIADVRRRTGLSAAALHHYEQIGLITSTGREGLRRQYDDSVVEVLAVVALCQRSGFTLAEIGQLIERRRGASWKSLAKAKLDELDGRIAALEQARIGLLHALDCPSLDIMRCEHFRSALDAVYPEPAGGERREAS